MKFSDLECCPFCGGEEYFERCRAKGIVVFNVRFDGEETRNEDMYDELSYTDSGRRWCTNCGRYLGNSLKNEVGVAAMRIITQEVSEWKSCL